MDYNQPAAQEELRRSFMARRLAKEKEEQEDEEKHALEQELHTATVAMCEEIASLADQYPLQLHDFAQKVPLKQGDRKNFSIHFAGPLAGCPPAVCNQLITSFDFSKGERMRCRGRLPRKLAEKLEIKDDDVRIEWNLDINPNGQPRGETQRAIQRWAPTTDDGKYEYRSWCFARATNRDLEKDLNNRIEARLQQLADSLSFAKREFASLAGEGRCGREIQERKVLAKAARHRQLHRNLMAKLKAMMEPFESGAKPATAQSVKNTFKNLEMIAILKFYYSMKEGVSSMNEDAMAEAIAISIVVQPTETTVAAPHPAPHAASDVPDKTSDN